LEHLADVLCDAASQMTALSKRARRLGADVRAKDGSFADLVASEERPLIITRMTHILDQLADAGAAVRRAEAHQLRGEGLSHAQIAKLFGVTRQRAAALLAPPPPPHARSAKRPKAGAS
jgi:hypothetical protein